MNESIRIVWLAGINIALAALAVGVLAGANLIWRDPQNWGHRETPFFLVVGLTYGHVLFIAALWSMGPWRWQVRVPVLAASWLLLVAIENVVFINTIDHPPESIVFGFLSASTAIIIVVLHLPLGPRFRRWRLEQVSASESRGKERTTFSLRDLFLWTTVVAVVLAGVRFVVLFLPNAGGGGEDFLRLTFIFSQVVAATLLLSWPLFWALWSMQGTWWKLIVSLVIAIAATTLECSCMIATTNPPDALELAFQVNCMNLTTYTLLALHAGTVRWLGYRLAGDERNLSERTE